MKLSPELGAKALRLVRDWNLGKQSEPGTLPDGIEILADGELGALEHVIHEMSHAALLGLEWAHGMSDEIGKALEKHADTGIDQEAQAWAVEWYVWEYLGLTQPGGFAFGDVIAAAEIQRCTPDQVESYLDDERCQMLAVDIAEYLVPGSTDQ